jgi:hypothetical protein
VRHIDVAEDDVVGMGGGPLESLMAVIGGIDCEPFFFQAGAQQVLSGFGIFKKQECAYNLVGGFYWLFSVSCWSIVSKRK